MSRGFGLGCALFIILRSSLKGEMMNGVRFGLELCGVVFACGGTHRVVPRLIRGNNMRKDGAGGDWMRLDRIGY